jgi:hypothetical protein
MSGYSIVDHKKIDGHITFIRINPDDVGLTLKEVFASLADLSWINSFDQGYIRDSLMVRAKPTIDNLKKKIFDKSKDSITTDSGECVVSELARKSVINELAYLDIPIAELFKQKKDGNPGFDFFSQNTSEIILFGEAKFLSNDNAYGSAFEQIVRFHNEKRDMSDLLDLRGFCTDNAMNNVSQGQKGYIAAFSSTQMDTAKLIKNIQSNADYLKISKFTELICVAVNV